MSTSSASSFSSKSHLTIYGATSFVAHHVISYLVQSSLSMSVDEYGDDDDNSKDDDSTSIFELQIVLAGRNRDKLNKLKTSWEKRIANLKTLKPESTGTCKFLNVVVADSTDEKALLAMAEHTAVVINCAGPFFKYSSNVVAACAQAPGCSYVDITGEVSWAADMRQKYSAVSKKAMQQQQQSNKDATKRIISFCGFDSIPSDLAVFVAVDALRKSACTFQDLEIVQATTWHSMQGLANGGTLHTLQETPIGVGEMVSAWGRGSVVPYLLQDPLALAYPMDQDEEESKKKDLQRRSSRMAMAEWYNQLLLHCHTNFHLGFSAPFFMAAINNKVVQATSVALNYGPKFVYYERFLPMGYIMTNHLGPLSLIAAFVSNAGVLLLLLLLKTPILGAALLRTFAPPGTGPSEHAASMGYAHVYAEATSVAGTDGRVDRASCLFKYKGDPGNFVTAQCVCEAALSLLFDAADLPPNSHDGFGTPAQLLGNVLLRRLKESHVRPVQVEVDVRRNVPSMEWQMYPEGIIRSTRGE